MTAHEVETSFCAELACKWDKNTEEYETRIKDYKFNITEQLKLNGVIVQKIN